MEFFVGLLIVIGLVALLKTYIDVFIFKQELPSQRSVAVANVSAPTRRSGIHADSLRAAEFRLFGLVNEARREHEIESGFASPLLWSEAAASVARGHSADMARRGFYDHVNPDGDDPGDRAHKAGVPFVMVGENIGRCCPTVDAGHIGLMGSPPHRENLLSSDYTGLGVGIVRDPDGGLIITQLFLRPEW